MEATPVVLPDKRSQFAPLVPCVALLAERAWVERNVVSDVPSTEPVQALIEKWLEDDGGPVEFPVNS